VTVPKSALPPEALAEIFIVAKVTTGDAVSVTRTEFHKCGRCWRLLPEVVQDGAPCDRCTKVVS
jgi:isoleucyl-tRNA synthetase